MESDRVEDLISMALAHYESGSFEKCIVSLTETLTLDPGHMGALSLRGLAYYMMQDHENAIHDYSRVIAKQPGNAQALNGRGLAFAGLQKYREAIRDFEEAIRLDPGFTDPRYNKLELERWLREEAGQYDQDQVPEE